MKMNLKKGSAWVLALVLMVALWVPALAEEWSTEEFTITVPQGMLRFDSNTSPEDPAWALAGIADPMKTLQDYQEMGVLANFVNQEDGTSLLVMKKESDYSKELFQLSQQDEAGRQAVLEKLAPQAEGIEVERSMVQGEKKDLWFYRIKLKSTDAQGAEVNEMLLGTIVNGYAVNFDVYTGSKEISPDQEKMLEETALSLQVKEILEKPPAPEPQELGAKGIFVLVTLVVVTLLVLAAPFIYFPLRNRRDKKKKAALTQRLSDYHKTHGKDVVEGAMRFSNTTDCTREAIHTFAVYHAYIKSIGSLLFGGGLCVILLVVVFALQAEWWMQLIAVGVAGYFGYKVFTTPTTIEKTQRKVYERGNSSTAVYAFYEDAFRVSGIQSASVFPYFQITDIRKHGHYLYLYYGPDNAYMVDQFGFAMGDYDSFYAFLMEKRKQG